MSNRIIIGLGFVFAFGVGCGAGVAASNLVVPPLRADQNNVTRWDYVCYDAQDLGSVEKITSQAKRLGAQGWEYAGPVGVVMCFKRPLAGAAAPPG